SYRICKGVRYRSGSVRMQRVTRDEQHQISSGRLYLTNKRVIYISDRGTKTIRLANVLAIKPFEDGVELQPSTGKALLFLTPGDPEERAILFSRLIQDA